jgi:NitT/TauT family transport system substrate-binding protein
MRGVLVRVIGGLLGALVVGCAGAPGSGPVAPTLAPAGSPTVRPTAAAAAPAPAAAAPEVAHLRLGSQRLATEAAVYIAEELGYFQQEGIEIEYVLFSSASEMIPAAATGQLEAVPMPANPAMWNAVARGVPIKVVLDLGTYRPEQSEQALAVRKALYDSGQVRQLEDLRGRPVALTPPGKATTSGCALSVALQRVGLTLDDLDIQAVPFPDMVAAFANGAVDAGMSVEPFLTRAIQQGTVVRLLPVGEMYPNFTIATLGFADTLYNNRPLAKGFVRAYIRAIRTYQAALRGTPTDAPLDRLQEILSRGTGLDVATIAASTPPYFNPNGLPNQESMRYCYQFFRDQGLIPQPVSDAAMQALWGTDLVNEVLAEIGRAPES